MVRTRCFSRIPFCGNRVLVDNSFKYNSTTVINFGADWGGYYQAPKYNGWNFVADLCQGALYGLGLAAMYGRCNWGGGAGGRTQVQIPPRTQTQTQTTDTSYDKDPKKIQDYLIEIEKYTGKTTLTEADKTGVKSLYKDIKARAEGMNHEDDIDSATNTKAYKLLLGKLTDKFDFDSDGNPTIKGAKAQEKPDKTQEVKPEEKTEKTNLDTTLANVNWGTVPNDKIPSNINLALTGYTAATADDIKADSEFTGAHDTGKPEDVNATSANINGKAYYISSAKTDGFPIYLVACDSKNYAYKFVKKSGENAIYQAPVVDGKYQLYILGKDKDGNLKLIQTKEFAGVGHDVGDPQPGITI